MKNILTVIDVQNDFITGSLANDEALKKVTAIVEKIEGTDWDAVFVTLDTHGDDYPSTKEGEKLPVRHCRKGTEGWKIQKDVKRALDSLKCPVTYIEKSSFGSLELPEKIAAFTAGELFRMELVGYVSSICLISNALILKARFYNSADIFIDAACTAGLSPENNAAALETARSCHIEVLNLD